MKSQIWIAVSVYVLVAIVKKRLDLDASPPCRSTMRVNVVQGRKSINWANKVLPVFMGDSG